MRSILLAATLVALPGHASDPFACVDEDVAAAFLGNAFQGTQPAFSTDAPEDFTKLSLPEGFALVGSKTEGTGRTVVYRSDEDKGAAYRAAIASMEENGWWELARPGQAQGGFQTDSLPSYSLLCGDDPERSLVVTAVRRSDRTFISYSEGTHGMHCNAAEGLARAPAPGARRMVPMPDLYLPEDIDAGYPGANGGDHQQTSYVDVASLEDRQAMAAHLEDQVREQEWHQQGGWATEDARGSTWTREIDGQGLAVANLLLMRMADTAERLSISVSWAAGTNVDQLMVNPAGVVTGQRLMRVPMPKEQ